MQSSTVLTVTGWSAVSSYGLGRDSLTEGFRSGRRTDTALVLGTTTGSLQSMMDFTRDSLTGDRPFDVDPTLIPNSVMNCAAAQCAIRHRIEGPNTTLACGRPSGLLALAYGRRLLVNGRADSALCGAAEEYTAARSWIEHHNRGGAPTLLGEGAAVLRVRLGTADDVRESAVLALHSRMRLPGASTAAVVAAVVRQALDRAGLTPDQVWAAVPSGLCAEETGALESVLGAEAVRQLPLTSELLGDTGAASAAFQLVAALATADRAPGRIAVVTSADPDGMVAAAVLRLAQQEQEELR
jgi:3-oxoacyl-[acyl-carrier-protein] synthase II